MWPYMTCSVGIPNVKVSEEFGCFLAKFARDRLQFILRQIDWAEQKRLL